MLTEKIIFFKKFIYWSEYNIEYKDFTTDRQKRKGPTIINILIVSFFIDWDNICVDTIFIYLKTKV